ncbi:MAG: LamG-like jellyroll fold domain-containing protein, partial [Patescibacteria group bacterium]
SGGCLAFDGLDDILTCGNNSSLWMGTRDHTVSLWVRFDTTTPTQDETLVMCGAGDSGLGHAGYWIYRRQATSILRLCFTDGSANQICNDLSANATPANNWYSVVIMFDRDATAYAYINGVKQTGYGVDIHLQNLFVQNVGVLRIGAWDGTFDRMAGKIDDVKMYHALVSSFQINENYFVGINKLFKNNGLALNEYNQKLVELKTNLALNKNTPN